MIFFVRYDFRRSLPQEVVVGSPTGGISRLGQKHTEAFGRAKAALDHVSEIGDISNMEALSLLGRCVAYGTICSSERFSTAIPKIRFVEVASNVLGANTQHER